MRILALDCATPSVGLALLEEEKVLGELYLDLGRHHAEVLLPAADRLLSLTGTSWPEIDLLACTIGPGSFTGVRIGISTTKGLALAIGKPIAGISTLEALAENGPLSGAWICPLIDARKGQVYTALYRRGADGMTAITSESRLIAIEALLQELPSGEIHFIGDGALCHHGLLRQVLGKRALIGAGPDHRILASAVGRIGLRHYRLGNLLNALTLTPSYLQLSAAEAHRKDPAGADTAMAPPGLAGSGSAVDISSGLR